MVSHTELQVSGAPDDIRVGRQILEQRVADENHKLTSRPGERDIEPFRAQDECVFGCDEVSVGHNITGKDQAPLPTLESINGVDKWRLVLCHTCRPDRKIPY